MMKYYLTFITLCIGNIDLYPRVELYEEKLTSKDEDRIYLYLVIPLHTYFRETDTNQS